MFVPKITGIGQLLLKLSLVVGLHLFLRNSVVPKSTNGSRVHYAPEPAQGTTGWSSCAADMAVDGLLAGTPCHSIRNTHKHHVTK